MGSVIDGEDVLDEPLSDSGGLLDLTVDSVKAHLARGGALAFERSA
jgi:RNA polymerase sigma-70 factor (ECF subfamily)